jgi:hypothetical protein
VGLPGWVVYQDPTLFARLWAGATPTETTMTADDLTELRHMIRRKSPYAIRFTRALDDDPDILEVWL